MATSATYHDALSASPYAYAKAAPVFLASASTKTLDAEALSAIKPGGFKRVVITGGTAAISSSLDRQLSDLGIQVARKGGATAYETSAEYDALTGAALCGKNNSALILVSDGNRSAIASFSNRANVSKAYVFGGSVAVSDATYKAIGAALS